MVDVVDKKTRSKMMAGIRGKDTIPEMLIRRGLHSRGFRYRLHYRGLPGKPDLIFPKYRALILINGCFWHGHDCHLFKWPKTRRQFWRNKIEANKKRDRKNMSVYRQEGWYVLTIWECSLKGKHRLPVEKVINGAADWLRYSASDSEISGHA